MNNKLGENKSLSCSRMAAFPLSNRTGEWQKLAGRRQYKFGDMRHPAIRAIRYLAAEPLCHRRWPSRGIHLQQRSP
jgi:hypothetical protein